MWKSLNLCGSLALIATMLVGVGQAEAHAVLVTADPAPNSSVVAPPKIALQFNEELSARFSKVKVTGTNGKAVAMKATTAENAKTLIATPAAALAPGQYKVSWTAVTEDDGHKMQGTFRFKVK